LKVNQLMNVTRLLWFLVVSAAAFAPLLLFLVNGADFSGVASESLGYRFFYSMRLYAGPDLTAWLPQGHLVTTLEHVINYFVLPTLDGSLDRLRAALNTFSYWTIAIINVTIVAVFLLAAAARSITWQDRALLTIVAFAPIYANQYAISYALWPDYYLLDVYFIAAAVVFFQWQWRSGSTARPWLRTVGVGVFVGLLTVNKISMLFVGGPLVAAVALSPEISWRTALGRTAIAAAAAIATFTFLYCAAGLFQIAWISGATRAWLKLVTNPGGDQGFLELILNFKTHYHYAVMVIWWLATLAMAVTALIRARCRSVQTLAIMAAALLGSLVCILFLKTRPAGTTFGEVCCQLMGYGAIFMTITPWPRAARASISAMAFAFLIATAISRPFDPVIWWATKSSKVADEQWQFFQNVMAHAGANGVRYYIPNNNHQFSDVFIMLLKGASNFATVDVTGSGRWILDKYAPGLSFVFDREQSGLESIPANSTVVWYDADWLENVPNHFPRLAAAIANPGAEDRRTAFSQTGFHFPGRVVGHIVHVP
jgi:hypothetical protein